jgi:hypothetical protein
MSLSTLYCSRTSAFITYSGYRDAWPGSGAPVRCGRGRRRGRTARRRRRGLPPGDGIRRARRRAGAWWIPAARVRRACGGTVAIADRDGLVEPHSGRRRSCSKSPGDARPIRLGNGGAAAWSAAISASRVILGDGVARCAGFEVREALGDQAAVPPRAVLIRKRDGFAGGGVDACGSRGGLEQESARRAWTAGWLVAVSRRVNR